VLDDPVRDGRGGRDRQRVAGTGQRVHDLRLGVAPQLADLGGGRLGLVGERGALRV
jgi:hypothetical protein